ncbi:hypothetical protein ACFWMG_04830 [Streptomyces sp. NPDC127074]|uniref:hypothetical protein n=1 Tax=Streptomyces sp. NPDC127074 TaxID=3347130 RepID=UPI00364FADFD
MARIEAQYATAGGATVDLMYGTTWGVGLVGKCAGCQHSIGDLFGPVGEVTVHEWAHQHAVQCAKVATPDPQGDAS